MSVTRADTRTTGILNFRGVNLVVPGRVGYQGAVGDDIILHYTGKKPGGSDIGHLVTAGSIKIIIKTGVSLSLLGKALKQSARGDADKERKFIGFIVGNFTRIAGDKIDQHPELADKLKEKHGDLSQKKLSELLTAEMLATLNQYKATDAGKAMLEKSKGTLDTNDIYSVYRYLVTQNEMLRDVIGLAAFSDLANGAFGQFFNNAYQERSIPRDMLDDHRLLLEVNEHPAMYMASRFNEKAEPFDKCLLQPFLDNKLVDFANKEAWLEKCKQDLSANTSNLKGLVSAILVRLIMGESADLGPDNMLIASQNNVQYIINIDVTGFRYARRNNFTDKKTNETRLGWEEVLKCEDSEKIINLLFDSSVFSNRFVKDAAGLSDDVKTDVMKAIVDVLKSKLNPSEVYGEVLDVRTWSQEQNLEGAVASLKAAMEEAYRALDPILKPHTRYLGKLVDHNISFIRDSIQVAQSLRQTQVATVSTSMSYFS